MGLTRSTLLGLKVFAPSSILGNDLDILETLKFETRDIRNQDFIEKDLLMEKFLNRVKSVKPKKPIPSKQLKIKSVLEDFCEKLDKTLLVKNDPQFLSEIKWDRIDELCQTMRRIERSNERKVRWALYYLWRSGKSTLSLKNISALVSDFKIKDISKIIHQILKKETKSGLVATFDGKNLKIDHELDDKLVWHYLGDEIEESSRRSPGEIENEILELVDEGSYSATELSDILQIDEATISRSLSKLRKNEQILLSSFGERGSRYFTTNCDNCPFGTTKAACRKDSIAYIIDYFKRCFNVELSAPDFEGIEENQALMKLRRVVSVAKKEKNTKLERSISAAMAELFGTAIDHALEIKPAKSPGNVKLETSDQMFNLPVLFHLGLFKGAETSFELINEIMKTTKGISKSDRTKIKKQVEEHSKKFLRYTGIKEKF